MVDMNVIYTLLFLAEYIIKTIPTKKNKTRLPMAICWLPLYELINPNSSGPNNVATLPVNALKPKNSFLLSSGIILLYIARLIDCVEPITRPINTAIIVGTEGLKNRPAIPIATIQIKIVIVKVLVGFHLSDNQPNKTVAGIPTTWTITVQISISEIE